MNKIIMKMAIAHVKSIVTQTDHLCEICRKNPSEIPETAVIEVKGMETEVGIATCKTCFDNIQIAIGEISEEY